MWPEIPKVGGSATSIFFTNCPSAIINGKKDEKCLAFNVLDYGKWYLEFLLVIVQKCKCAFGVLYMRYSLMWPGIPKLGGILGWARHLFSLWTVQAQWLV